MKMKIFFSGVAVGMILAGLFAFEREQRERPASTVYMMEGTGDSRRTCYADGKLFPAGPDGACHTADIPK